MNTHQTALEIQASYLIEDRIHPTYRVLPHKLRRRHRMARPWARP